MSDLFGDVTSIFELDFFESQSNSSNYPAYMSPQSTMRHRRMGDELNDMLCDAGRRVLHGVNCTIDNWEGRIGGEMQQFGQSVNGALNAVTGAVCSMAADGSEKTKTFINSVIDSATDVVGTRVDGVLHMLRPYTRGFLPSPVNSPVIENGRYYGPLRIEPGWPVVPDPDGVILVFDASGKKVAGYNEVPPGWNPQEECPRPPCEYQKGAF